MTIDWRRIALAMLAVLLSVMFLPSAQAIPVFARKYQTSCQTCHVGFPKLNPFGQAFRLNGYRMPKETEDQIKIKPVSLGADAYKKMWPNMIYPSDLPGGVPLAFNIKLASVYSSSVGADGRTITHNDFQFPQEANLFTAGTFGEHMAFLGELTHAENPDGSSGTEIEHAQIQFNSLMGPEHLVNFKIGKFAPDLADGFQEMWIATDTPIDTLFGFDPIGVHGGTGVAPDAGAISLPASVKGIEMYGVANHRFFYTVGVANGLGPSSSGNTDANATKDVYARVDYKFGGMALDGDSTGVTLPPENWREKSFRIGVLGYSGNGKGFDFPMTDDAGNAISIQDRHFTRGGVYASAWFNDLNVFGVAMRGRDKLDTFDDSHELTSTNSYTYTTWFVQGDYVIKPPLQASLRYESVRPPDRTADNVRVLVAALSFYPYANVKAMVDYARDLKDSKNYQISTILRFAF